MDVANLIRYKVYDFVYNAHSSHVAEIYGEKLFTLTEAKEQVLQFLYEMGRPQYPTRVQIVDVNEMRRRLEKE